ncbi:hypothetical protein Tco_0673502 [Tanacetum coccineum]
MGQPTVWVAQPHGWESDEAPTARLEGCTGRLEAFCPGFYFPFESYASRELDEATYTLMQTEQVAPQPGQARRQRHEPRGLDSSWGDWNVSLNKVKHVDVWRDSILIRNHYMLDHSMPILHHFKNQSNFAYPTYEPPNVPLYPYLYVPYPYPYTHYLDMGSPSVTPPYLTYSSGS